MITSRHVLSAAHCFKVSFDIVRLGEHDISESRNENRIDMPIKRVDVHENYDRRTELNDIAIVHLLHDVKFTGKFEKNQSSLRLAVSSYFSFYRLH